MDRLLQIGLTNALAATGLALLAAAISRVFRRPPLTRALWILVLLKLLTPPIWSVPVWHPVNSASTVSMTVPFPTPPAVAPHDELQNELIDAALVQAPAVQESAPPAPAATKPPPRSRIDLPAWPTLVGAIWLLGSAIYASAVLIAAFRVRRLIARSTCAPQAVMRRVRRLAALMGVGRCPTVAFLDRPLPPMLCAIGTSPRILLPISLWQRLDERQQDTVLAHELAHLRRRDHWARALELLASVLYWWHPVVWWSRYELREAAEQCCDAWVVWSMPRLAKSYAAALVEAIEFISSAPAAVPALASTMGQFTDLKRRLVMIRQGNSIRSLTRPALAAVFSAAGLLLPLSPSFAQEIPLPPIPSVAPVPVAPPTAETAPIPAAAQAAPEAPAASAQQAAQEQDQADGQNNADRPEVQKARAEVQQLRAQLRAAERRLSDLQRAGRRSEQTQNRGSRAVPPTPASPRAGNFGGPAPRPGYPPNAPLASRNRNTDEALSRADERLRAAGQQLNDARDRSRQSIERRIDAMERQMNTMLNQLRDFKRQLSDQPRQESAPEAQGF